MTAVYKEYDDKDLNYMKRDREREREGERERERD